MAGRKNSKGKNSRKSSKSQALKNSTSKKKNTKGTKKSPLKEASKKNTQSKQIKFTKKDSPTKLPNNTSKVVKSSAKNKNIAETKNTLSESTKDISTKLPQDNSMKAKEKSMNNTKKPPSVKSNTSTKGKKTKKGKKKVFKWIGLSALFLFLASIVVGLGFVIAIIKNTPPVDVNKVLSNEQTAKFTYRNDKYWTQLNSKEDRTPLKSDQIPKNLKNAIVAIEDERFYDHHGVDPKRLLGATFHSIVYKLTGKGGLQGGSTLTQQLVKNTLLTNEQSIERKVKEMYLSLELEKSLTKDQILTAYLNSYPVGGVAYGAGAGAEMYFDKPAKDLNLIQSAFLAGITQAPTAYSPFTEAAKKDPSRYLNRTKTVLFKMNELGFISKEEYDKAIKDLDNGKLKFKSSKKTYKLPHEDFLYATLDQVKADLKAKYKYSDEEVNSLISTGGLVIHSTMDKDLQEHTQQVLNNYSNFNLAGYDQVDKDGTPLVQAAATVIDYKTGEVVAMVGGRGEQGAQSLNRAYTALNPVGSAVKPLTVYGPAIDTKVMTAGSTIYDAPIPKSVYHFSPKNSPDQYKGLIPLRDSLKYSSNVGAYLTELKVGPETGTSYGEEFGLKFNKESKNTMSATALGQFNNDPNDIDGGNPYIMAAALGTFGNDGKYVKPRLYTTVKDASGKVILESKKESKQILSPQAAYIVYDMMKGPISYNAGGAKFGSMPVAGKTGTTTDSKDLWFAGLTPHYSGAVWFGRDDNKMLPSGRSSSTAASIWGKIMSYANEGLSTTDIKRPSGIVEVPICSVSGELATDLCKNAQGGEYTRGVYNELFIAGTEPTSYCETHVSAKVNSANGMLAGPNTPSGLLTNKIFINCPNPYMGALDSKFYLPTSQDNTTAPAEPEKPKDEQKPDENKDNKPDENVKPPETGDNTNPPSTGGTGENGETPPQTTPPTGGTTAGGTNVTPPKTPNNPPKAN